MTTTAALVGTRLGGLTIERELGAGGFGSVYLGRPDVGAPKALKVLKDKGLAGALRREAEALLSVRHPRVVELVQADLSNDPPFLVMELVEGGSLADRLPLEVEEARRVCRGILEGLAHAHARGVAHLDLKPQNVLLAADGPKIADLGLARAVVASGQTLEHSHASSGALKGTLAYMAPEVKEGQPGDLRADVYAFGVLLCQVLTGKLPQPGDTLEELMGREPPTWAKAVFSRSYCRYEKRFTNAGEVLAALDSGASPPATTDSARLPGTPADGPKKTRCPFCKEEIAEGAIKCRHCNERLDQTKPITARGAGVMCAVHLERTGAGTCVSCGNFFCAECMSPVKGKNHCKACVHALVEEKDKAIEKAQEQAEREKDRAAKSGGPNIVVNATGGSSSASSSASAAATAIAGGGGHGGRAIPPIRLADPVKAALLSLLLPGLGHVYVGRRVRGAVLALASFACVIVFLKQAYGGSINSWGSLTLHMIGLGWPWVVGPILAYRAGRKVNAERQAVAREHGVPTFADPFFKWTFLTPVGTHDAAVDAAGRPQQACLQCGYTWQPRGRDFSLKCPRCSAPVAVGAQGGARFAKLGVLAVLMCVCLVMGAYNSIKTAFREEEQRQREEEHRQSQLAHARQDLDEGKAAFQRGDWATAVRRLEAAMPFVEATDIPPQMLSDARQRLRAQLVGVGVSALGTSDFEAALAKFNEAQALGQDAEVARHIAAARYGLGRRAMADRQWSRAVQHLNGLREPADAEQLLAEARGQLAYEDTVAMIGRAEADARAGKHREALRTLATADAHVQGPPPAGRESLNQRLTAALDASRAGLYDEAVAAEGRNELANARDMFRELGGYRDAGTRATALEERIGAVRAEEERRQAAARAEEEQRQAAARAQEERRRTTLEFTERLTEATLAGSRRDFARATEALAAAERLLQGGQLEASAAQRLEQTRASLVSAKYTEAIVLERGGRNDDAIQLLREIGDYEDAPQRLADLVDPAAAERALRQQVAGQTFLIQETEPREGARPITKTIRFDQQGTPTYYDGGLSGGWRITEVRYTGRRLRISVAANQPLFQGYPIETLDGVLSRDGVFVGQVAHDMGRETTFQSEGRTISLPRHSTDSYSGRLSR